MALCKIGPHHSLPLILVIMMQACLRSGSSFILRPVVAVRSSSTLLAYSKATEKRILGLNRTTELAKLAVTMKVEQDDLRKKLSKSLVNMDPKTEKSEYINWLLSTTEKSKTERGTKKAGKKTNGSNVDFAGRSDLHPHSKRAVTELMGLKIMTEIQAKTFEAASTGRDVLGRARTGTGKTIAFLLPAIERLLQSENFAVDKQVGILVVSPTRELATQIADQAEKLLSFHKDMSVQVVFGGTNIKRDVSQLKRRLPTILVATPGRLLDHLQSTHLDIKGSFGKNVMSQTPIVVLDETDRLLDMGFRKDISKILSFLNRNRQTLLFSATIPPDLKKIMAQNMKKDFITVDCISDGDANTHTNAKVKQSHVIVQHDRYVSSVVEIVRLAMAEDEPKIIVFFPTARMVSFFAEFFNVGLGISVLELHSKKSQGYRNRVSETFRNADSAVLFTSDVSARGVDYPNVSHVLQFGIPESREQYIHRLGRTGRAGTEGEGWLVLSPWESLFLQELKGLNIPVNNNLRDLFQGSVHPETQALLESAIDKIRNGNKVLSKSAKRAYQAFLGYYLGQMKRMRMTRKEDLVAVANEFSISAGLLEPPPLTSRLVGKMGLKGVKGISIGSSVDVDGNDGGGKPKWNSGMKGTGRYAPKPIARRPF